MKLIFASVFFAFFYVISAILLFVAEMVFNTELFTNKNMIAGSILFMLFLWIFGNRK